MVSRQLVLALVISSAAVILALAVGPRVSPTAAAQSGPGLEGSWMSEVSSQLAAGTRLTTYNADGTLITTAIAAGVIPTTGHGSWVRTGEREFATTWFGFSRDAEGNYTAMTKVRGRLQLNGGGDEISSRSQVEVMDRNGNVLRTDSPTGQAKRIRVELPN